MKILQKQTSRFVASLFNGLGIIACVSVSSCGSKGKNSKGNETDKFDGLKKKLKEANDNFGQLDSVPQNKIAQWFKDNPSQTNFAVTKDILEEIFIDDDKFKSVAQTLGVDISDTDAEENKLDSDDLKKKVAQKNIEKNIDSTDANTMNKAVSEVKNEAENKKVTVKIEKYGNARIVYSDNHSESFDFKDLEALKNFVNALEGKNVVVQDGNFSLVLGNDKAKVCGHKDGFDYKDYFNEFLSCLNSLVQINNLGFKSFEMTVKCDGVSLDGNKLNEGDCKKSDFWTQVKDYPALFGLVDSPLQIEQNDKTVKINGFETDLQWSFVAKDEKTVNDTWKGVFVIHGKEEVEEPKKEEPKKEEPKKEEPKKEEQKKEEPKKEEPKKEEPKKEEHKKEEKKKAKVKEEEKKTTTISYDMINTKAKVGNDVVELTKLKEKLNGLNSQNVEIAKFPKWDTFKTFDSLKNFLTFVQTLAANKIYDNKIAITIEGNNVVKFDGVALKGEFAVKDVKFWQSIKSYSSLFQNKLYIKFIAHSWPQRDALQIFHKEFPEKLPLKNDFISIKCVDLKNIFFNTTQKDPLTLKTEWQNLFLYNK